MTINEFDKIVQQAREIAFGKNGQSGKHFLYNSSNKNLYKELGIEGEIAMIWRKAIRFAEAMKHKQFDHLREDALDLIVYTARFCIVYDELKGEKNDSKT